MPKFGYLQSSLLSNACLCRYASQLKGKKGNRTGINIALSRDMRFLKRHWRDRVVGGMRFSLLMLAYLFSSCTSSGDRFQIEYYITPVESFLRMFDNGVYWYPLEQRSIPGKILSYESGTGEWINFYGMYYFSEKVDASSYDRYYPLQDSGLTFCSPVKALVIYHRGIETDTFEVDNNKYMKMRGETFVPSKEFYAHMAFVLPKEYVTGWIYGPFYEGNTFTPINPEADQAD